MFPQWLTWTGIAYWPLVLIPGHMALDTALSLSLELLKQSTPASIHVSWDQFKQQATS
jgi:hypothetical protein